MMLVKKWIAKAGLISMCLASAHAQTVNNGYGQFIQIHTRFHSFIGKPIWTLIIRDIDHNENIPYVFDILRGDNYWVVPTFGRNYLIQASRLQIETYQSRYNKFKNYRMKNFCNIESNGRILRGESMYITIEGDLSPYTNTFWCNITTFQDDHIFMYNPQSN